MASDQAFKVEFTVDGEPLSEYMAEKLAGWKIDVILPDATHRYWSTHCRHDNHDACSATSIAGPDAEEPRILHAIERRPAQCKTCSAPCVCPCHGAAWFSGDTPMSAGEQMNSSSVNEEMFGTLVVHQLNTLFGEPCCAKCCAPCRVVEKLLDDGVLPEVIGWAPEHLGASWQPLDEAWLRSRWGCQSNPPCGEVSDAD